MNGTLVSAIFRSGIREIITNLWPGRPLTRIYEEIDLLSHEKYQVCRLSSIQEAVGLLSDTIQLLRENENYIRSEVANLSTILNGPQGNVV